MSLRDAGHDSAAQRRNCELHKRRMQHRMRKADATLTTGMRKGHLHRTALLRHLLAAIPLRLSHLRTKDQTRHCGIAKQEHQQQSACELADDFQVPASLRSLRLPCTDA